MKCCFGNQHYRGLNNTVIRLAWFSIEIDDAAAKLTITYTHTHTHTQDAPKESKWSVFAKQQCMAIAPPPRSPLLDTSLCDKAIQEQNYSRSYLVKCKESRAQKQREKGQISPEMCSDNMECDDVIVTSSPNVAKPKFKLLQFHSNVRPAYYGSWRKRSKLISGRNPFKMDKVS